MREREPAYPPEYDEDPPCEICGRETSACVCPECETCNSQGDPKCIEEHGLKPALRRCEPCNGVGAVLEVLNDWYPGSDVVEPVYGGPMVCMACSGRGEVLVDWPPHQSIAVRVRELSNLEDAFKRAEEERNKLYEEMATASFCRCCGGRYRRGAFCVRCEDTHHTHYMGAHDKCPFATRRAP